MLDLTAEYTDAEAASASYPAGSFKNETTPGAGDGTPLEKAWADDLWGSREAVLAAAGLTRSGAKDTATASDFYDALMVLIARAGFSTGDVKLTLKTSAPVGWIMANDGTIGSATSGATTRANADCEDLFLLLWTNVSDTYAPVAGGRGVSAAADWAANKTIGLTRMLGRALAVSGAGSGLTLRALGYYTGTETHALVVNELPSHSHTYVAPNSFIGAGGGAGGLGGTTINTSSIGGNTAHPNMQPTSFLNAMIKL